MGGQAGDGMDYKTDAAITAIGLLVVVAATFAIVVWWPHKHIDDITDTITMAPIPGARDLAPATPVPYPFGEDTNPRGFPPGWG